jgi:hypothetical protein
VDRLEVVLLPAREPDRVDFCAGFTSHCRVPLISDTFAISCLCAGSASVLSQSSHWSSPLIQNV